MRHLLTRAGILCFVAALAACTPEDAAGGIDDEALAGGGGIDSGSIHEEPDVPDANVDIDPDLLKSHQTCAQVLQCASEFCKTNASPGCDAACVDDASKASAASYALYGDCRNKVCAAGVCKGNGNPNCVNACLLQRCSTSLFRCNAEGAAGAKDCATMVACHKQCADAAKARQKAGLPSQQFSCLNSCYKALSGAAQTRYDQWATCFAHSQAAEPYDACLVPLLTCGANGGQGTGDCVAIANCVAGCEKQTGKAHDHQSCIGACYGAGAGTAQDAWQSVLKCRADLGTNAASGVQCAAALSECAKPAGALSCQGVLDCIATCQAKGEASNCNLTCLAQASKASASDYSALLWCSMKNCDPSCQGKAACLSTCQGQQCSELLAACKQ